MRTLNPTFKTAITATLVATSLSFMSGCASKVSRVDVNSVQDYSGKWNDTDSRLVSKAMIEDMLSRPWLRRFTAKNRNQPVVIVGKMRNRSHEHINTRTFVNDMERELTNAGTIDFVANSGERDEVRAEREDQQYYSSKSTRKQTRQETGADFMLTGEVNTIVDKEDPVFYLYKDKVTFYQVNMTLIDLQSNRKVWIGEKKIKKIVGKAAIR